MCRPAVGKAKFLNPGYELIQCLQVQQLLFDRLTFAVLLQERVVDAACCCTQYATSASRIICLLAHLLDDVFACHDHLGLHAINDCC